MKIALTILLEFVISGTLWAGTPRPDLSLRSPVSYDEEERAEAVNAPYVIFSNLDSTKGDRFSTNPFAALPVAGKSAGGGETERWDAVRFSPKVDVQAKMLAAAIGYTSGTKLVTLGIYSNNEATNSVGEPLSGGQASTSRIPALDDCCQVTTVTLPGEGVLLSANEIYWLVAGPDNSQGADFLGAWHVSNFAASAGLTPPSGWVYPNGAWPAAEIRGMQVRMSGSSARNVSARSSPNASRVIFSNLDRTSDVRYLFGAGLPLNGNQVPFEPEIWRALPFTPNSDYHAKTLGAAIGWSAGTKLLNLGIYSDEAGEVGSPLPGGQGTATDIPELGDCCKLATVILPGTGIQLTKGVQYWLVASPDNTRAPDFEGAWQQSVFAVSAYQEPENFVNWTSFSGLWLAAEIRGTSP